MSGSSAILNKSFFMATNVPNLICSSVKCFNVSETGTIEYMTADDGWTFTPPASYSYTLTGLKTDSEVRIYNAADDSELGGIESSGTTFAYNYTYGGSDITAYVIVFHLEWKEVRLLNQTLSNSNQSIPIQQSIDRVYLNP